LTAVLLYQFEYNFTTQDTIIDSHEHYFYSEMVDKWGSPPDTSLILEEIKNLKMWCGIFKKEIGKNNIAYPGDLFWSTLPPQIEIHEIYTWSKSTYLSEMYNIKIPLEVIFGDINNIPVTVVDNGEYLFYLVIDYISPGEGRNVVFAFILALIFILGLYFFIRHYLRPVQLMKNRIKTLEEGDLDSEIEILGEDELADLSKSMNKLIYEVNMLLENKHQLLLEVSHELRSPLARMQFLIEMLPEHKNNLKLRSEINLLEVMIDNLLLSDRLSMPYSKLDLKKIKLSEILLKVLRLFPLHKEKIIVNNFHPNEFIKVDETKFILCIRNLIDNALKYSDNQNIEIKINKNEEIELHVKDSGIGISEKNIEKITEPFFQTNQSVSSAGFGLGLSICKKIIESHKGHLSVSSKEGEGSTFTLFLPII
jgi:signal transduction histidine kinase